MKDKKCSHCGYIFNGQKIAIMRDPSLETCHCGNNYGHYLSMPFEFPKINTTEGGSNAV